MEDHGEEQDYHLEEDVEHDEYLGDFLLLRDHQQHKTGLALGQGVFFKTVLLLLFHQEGRVVMVELHKLSPLPNPGPCYKMPPSFSLTALLIT